MGMTGIGQISLGLALVLSLAGCAAQDVTRTQAGLTAADMAPVMTHQDHLVADQADALRDLTGDLLRKATLKGAAFGAVLGCGLATVIGDGGCVPAALVGGAIGGVAGHASGQRAIARQIEIISPDAVLPALSRARAQSRRVETGVHALLAAQDAQLAAMAQRVAQGTLPQADLDQHRAEIRQMRADLANALLQSAEQTRATRAAILAARDQGQDGLDWYLSATDELERQVISTRSAIDLL